MHELFQEIYDRIAHGLRDVYPAFDAVPLTDKSDRRITVVEPLDLDLALPIPDGGAGVRQFKATVRVSVLTAMDVPVTEVIDYLGGVILPRLYDIGRTTFRCTQPTPDLHLRRVVTRIEFTVYGLYLAEEEEDADGFPAIPYA